MLSFMDYSKTEVSSTKSRLKKFRGNRRMELMTSYHRQIDAL